MSLHRKITTPATISDAIVAFAAELSPGHSPIYLEVRRETYARPLNCFGTVEEKVRRDGGTQVNGWTIWEHPKAFLSAEFHAVWKPDNGELQCVSHHIDGEVRILFVPEPTRLFLGRNVPNRFKALTYHREVHDFIALSVRMGEITSGAIAVPPDALSLATKVMSLHAKLNKKF